MIIWFLISFMTSIMCNLLRIGDTEVKPLQQKLQGSINNLDEFLRDYKKVMTENKIIVNEIHTKIPTPHATDYLASKIRVWDMSPIDITTHYPLRSLSEHHSNHKHQKNFKKHHEIPHNTTQELPKKSFVKSRDIFSPLYIRSAVFQGIREMGNPLESTTRLEDRVVFDAPVPGIPLEKIFRNHVAKFGSTHKSQRNIWLTDSTTKRTSTLRDKILGTQSSQTSSKLNQSNVTSTDYWKEITASENIMRRKYHISHKATTEIEATWAYANSTEDVSSISNSNDEETYLKHKIDKLIHVTPAEVIEYKTVSDSDKSLEGKEIVRRYLFNMIKAKTFFK